MGAGEGGADGAHGIQLVLAGRRARASVVSNATSTRHSLMLFAVGRSRPPSVESRGGEGARGGVLELNFAFPVGFRQRKGYGPNLLAFWGLFWRPA